MPKENATKFGSANERERERESKRLRRFITTFFLAFFILIFLPQKVFANDLTPHNGVSHVSSLTTDGAAQFTAASTQWLDIPSNSTLQGGATDLTFAGWVKLDSLSAPRVIVSKDNDLTSAGSEYYLGYYPGYGSWVFQVETSVSTTRYKISSTGTPSLNTWYFVVGWYDHINGTVNIQVNNGTVDTSTGAESSTHVTDTPFTIGSDYNTNDNTGHSLMDGAIDSVGFWKRVLTADERTSLYANGQSVGTNPGTLQTGTSYSVDVPSALSGNINSVSFDGNLGYILPTNPVALAASGAGVSLWFKADAFGNFLIGNSGSPHAYIRLLSSTAIRVQTDVTGTYKDFTVLSMNTGTWYNLIINRDASNNTHVYLNGTESSSGGQSQPTNPITINQVGRYWDNSVGLAYAGKLSELKLFQSSLTTSDISALSSGGASTTVPVLYWKLNEGSGTQAVDYGTITGGNPLKYSALSTAMLTESRSTFVSWWDLGETSGTRYDSRTIAPTTSDSGTDTSWHTTFTVTLTCSDGAGSGCANTYYTTDGSTPTTSSTSGNSVGLSSSGNLYH